MSQGFWASVRDRLADGEPVFVSLVAHHTRHSPGSRGARLLVDRRGRQEGTVGGGAMELRIVEEARRLLDLEARPAPRTERLVHRKRTPGDATADDEQPSGMICAGHQTNVHAVLAPERDLAAAREAAVRVARDEPGRVVLSPDGLSLEEEPEPTRHDPPVRLVERGGSWRVEEQLLEWRRAAIIGGGHCGLALSRTLAELGYVVTVFDTRPEVATFRDNPHAAYRVPVDDYAEAAPRIAHPELTHLVVMTTDQPSDVRGLLGVARRPFPYVGVMGSPAKLAAIRRDLAGLGVDETEADRWHAPVGLPEVPSSTPAEIAVGVAAQILAERPRLFPHTVPPNP